MCRQSCSKTRDAREHLQALKCPQLNWSVWWHNILPFPLQPPRAVVPSDLACIPRPLREVPSAYGNVVILHLHSLKHHRVSQPKSGWGERLFLFCFWQLCFCWQAFKLLALLKRRNKNPEMPFFPLATSMGNCLSHDGLIFKKKKFPRWFLQRP